MYCMQIVEIIKNILKEIFYFFISDYEFIVPNSKIYQYLITIKNKVKCIKIHYVLIVEKET